MRAAGRSSRRAPLEDSAAERASPARPVSERVLPERAAPKRSVPKRTAREPVAWSEEREALFLDVLARTCNIRQAVRASGLSSAAVYRRRDASDSFRAAWAKALREAYVRLETDLVGRAVNGVRKPVWHGGKKVGSVVEHSERLALALLARHRETCVGSAAVPQPDARAELIETLARMNRGMGGAG